MTTVVLQAAQCGAAQRRVGVDVALFVRQDAIACGAEMSGVAFGKNGALPKAGHATQRECWTDLVHESENTTVCATYY